MLKDRSQRGGPRLRENDAHGSGIYGIASNIKNKTLPPGVAGLVSFYG